MNSVPGGTAQCAIGTVYGIATSGILLDLLRDAEHGIEARVAHMMGVLEIQS